MIHVGVSIEVHIVLDVFEATVREIARAKERMADLSNVSGGNDDFNAQMVSKHYSLSNIE